MLWSKVDAYSTSVGANGHFLITFTHDDSIFFSTPFTATVLLVGGGGGGGFSQSCTGGGGGGGGGVCFGTLSLSGSYSVVVGKGGYQGSGGYTALYGNGANIYVYGGGYGNGITGGSGGGGSGTFTPLVGGVEPIDSSGGGVDARGCPLYFYGNVGSVGKGTGTGGGGGGAAGPSPDGYSGGPPTYWAVTGGYYGAGGGAGGGGNGVGGGIGICCTGNALGYPGGTNAGNGGQNGCCGGSATPNTGAGGGGSGCQCAYGGTGGDGVLIIAYCAPGSYIYGDSCVSCPAGTYTGTGGLTSCTPCPAGTIGTTSGATACTPCPAGTYSTYGASTCTSCRGGTYSTVPGTGECPLCPAGTFSNSGATSCTSCPAVAYYTPSGSAACHCNPIQTSVNLCSLLFQSDITLKSYSASFTNTTDVFGVSKYLLNILKIEVDINGDGIISRTEITAALGYRSIQSSALASIPVWNNANYTDSVPVTDLFNDAISFFTNSPKHTFDGSGANDLLSITSSYPNPSWDSSLCYHYDSFLNPSYSSVSVTWQYTQPFTNIVAGGLAQVCGYVNGRLIKNFDDSASLNFGTQTTFQDDGDDTDLSFKRVYCLVTLHMDFTTQFQCSLGLYYVSFQKREIFKIQLFCRFQIFRMVLLLT